MLEVRKSEYKDLGRMEEIFSAARIYMKESGNPNQWKDDRPDMNQVNRDIEAGNSYIIEDNDRVVGTFAFIRGIDPTYLKIDGAWIDDAPYGTIHRIASDGSVKGVFETALRYAESFGDDVRIDTHKDNKTMLHLIEKNGFQRCGIIYLMNGEPRIAFQKKVGR